MCRGRQGGAPLRRCRRCRCLGLSCRSAARCRASRPGRGLGPRGRARLDGSPSPLARPVAPAAGGSRSLSPPPRRSLATCSRAGFVGRVSPGRPADAARSGCVRARAPARLPVSRETGARCRRARAVRDPGTEGRGGKEARKNGAERERGSPSRPPPKTRNGRKLRSGPGSLPAAAREGPAAGVGRAPPPSLRGRAPPAGPALRRLGRVRRRRCHAATVAPVMPLPRVGAGERAGAVRVGRAGRVSARAPRVAATWLILPVAYACLKA